MVDVAYSLAALGIIAVGYVCSRWLLRGEQPRTRPSDLRQRQIGREADESAPIVWRR